MRDHAYKRLRHHRIKTGLLASRDCDGNNGAFVLFLGMAELAVIASDGADWTAAGLDRPAWEHVSVSLAHRCPTWDEMDHVKPVFWRDDETVMQLHVPTNDHVNIHNRCLHLWKPIGLAIPRPPFTVV